MKALIIEGTSSTPKVIFDPESNVFELQGYSLLDNALDFYEPIISWVKKYSKNPNYETILKIRMRFFNTASSKTILDVLFAFEEILKTNRSIKISWYYKKIDLDMKEAGEDYKFMVDLPFEYIPFN